MDMRSSSGCDGLRRPGHWLRRGRERRVEKSRRVVGLRGRTPFWGATPVPPSHADLDIAPRWIEADWALDVGLKFTASDANTNIDDWAHDDGTLKVDLNKLLASAYSAEEYSDTLAWMIFQHLKVASFYRSSLDQAQERPQ